MRELCQKHMNTCVTNLSARDCLTGQPKLKRPKFIMLGEVKRNLLLAVLIPVLSSCVSLREDSEANVTTLTCIITVGSGCTFTSSDEEDTTETTETVDKHYRIEQEGVVPPIGNHALP